MARTPPLRSACAKLPSTASDASEGGKEGEGRGRERVSVCVSESGREGGRGQRMRVDFCQT